MNEAVCIEQAEKEFDGFVEAMDLDLDPVNMDAEDRTAFDRQKRRIIKAVMARALVFNEEGEAVYTPRHKKSVHRDPITFHERTGASLMAMDGKKKSHEVAKTYAILADMCRVHPKVFADLAGEDVKVCEALFALLMD